MDFLELVKEARSCRRFDESKPLSNADLEWLVYCASLAPSARNAQELRYITITGKDICDRLVECSRWATALKNWNGPVKGERPTAFIAILMPETGGDILCFDTGIASQTIQLAATSKGWATCIVYSFNRETVKELLPLPAGMKTGLLLALGVPAEKRVIDVMPASGSYDYWRDEQNVHHVPKRSVTELIFKNL